MTTLNCGDARITVRHRTISCVNLLASPSLVPLYCICLQHRFQPEKRRLPRAQPRRNRMEKAAAVKIIQQLADGTDPHTGKSFGADSPYQHPDTVRALFVALRALDAPVTATPAAGKQRTAAPAENAPSNSGKPWSDDE